MADTKVCNGPLCNGITKNKTDFYKRSGVCKGCHQFIGKKNREAKRQIQ